MITFILTKNPDKNNQSSFEEFLKLSEKFKFQLIYFDEKLDLNDYIHNSFKKIKYPFVSLLNLNHKFSIDFFDKIVMYFSQLSDDGLILGNTLIESKNEIYKPMSNNSTSIFLSDKNCFFFNNIILPEQIKINDFLDLQNYLFLNLNILYIDEIFSSLFNINLENNKERIFNIDIKENNEIINYNFKFNDKCNSNCFFCDLLDKKNINFKSFEEIKSEIDKLKLSRINNITLYCNTDMRKDFFQILKYLKSLNILVTLETNGRIFSYDKFSEEVLKLVYKIKYFGDNNVVFKETLNSQFKLGLKNIIKYSNNKNLLYKLPVRFMILGEGRSGSSYLANLLQSHPNLLYYGDIYNYGLFPDNLMNMAIKKPLSPLINSIYKPHPIEIKAVGFKLFYTQARKKYFVRDLKENSGESKRIFENHHRIHNLIKQNYNDENSFYDKVKLVWSVLQQDPHIRIIHLTRKNLLNQLLSLRLARKTDYWNSRFGDYNTHTIMISKEDCKSYFEVMQSQIDLYEQKFSEKKVLRLYYEDLVENRNDVLNNVMDFLELPHTDLSTDFKKQNTRKTSDCITNFEELKKYFSKTRWSIYFED